MATAKMRVVVALRAPLGSRRHRVWRALKRRCLARRHGPVGRVLRLRGWVWCSCCEEWYGPHSVHAALRKNDRDVVVSTKLVGPDGRLHG